METTMLLEIYLKQLRLPTFLHNYDKFAEDAARAIHSDSDLLSVVAFCRRPNTHTELHPSPSRLADFW